MAAFLAASAFLLIPACNKADNAVDCNGICERYQTCFDATYDSGACQDRCRDDADTEGYATEADGRAALITDQGGAAATFEFAPRGGGLVPDALDQVPPKATQIAI